MAAEARADELFAREAALLQLQEARDWASSCEQRARDAEKNYATADARSRKLVEQLSACETRANDAEMRCEIGRAHV